jgi:hypothetical protein
MGFPMEIQSGPVIVKIYKAIAIGTCETAIVVKHRQNSMDRADAGRVNVPLAARANSRRNGSGRVSCVARLWQSLAQKQAAQFFRIILFLVRPLNWTQASPSYLGLGLC